MPQPTAPRPDAGPAREQRDARALASHVRQPLPRRRGNSFYKDRRDLARFAATLCGAAVTDRDWDVRSARAKRNAAMAAIEVCPACLAALEGK